MFSIGGGAPPISILPGDYTVSTLPSAATNTRKYAWVTDLHDGAPDYVISDGSFWKPVRPLAVRSIADANSSMTFTTLTNSPTQILKGALTAVRTNSIMTTNAYKGARFRMKREATGLFAMIINGVSLNTSSWADFEFDGTSWIQTASGGLL